MRRGNFPSKVSRYLKPCHLKVTSFQVSTHWQHKEEWFYYIFWQRTSWTLMSFLSQESSNKKKTSSKRCYDQLIGVYQDSSRLTLGLTNLKVTETKNQWGRAQKNTNPHTDSLGLQERSQIGAKTSLVETREVFRGWTLWRIHGNYKKEDNIILIEKLIE